MVCAKSSWFFFSRDSYKVAHKISNLKHGFKQIANENKVQMVWGENVNFHSLNTQQRTRDPEIIKIISHANWTAVVSSASSEALEQGSPKGGNINI